MIGSLFSFALAVSNVSNPNDEFTNNADLAARLINSISNGNGEVLSEGNFELLFSSAWTRDENGSVNYEFIDKKLGNCEVSSVKIERESVIMDWKCKEPASFLPPDEPNDQMPRRCFNTGYTLAIFYWTDTPQIILRDRADWSTPRCGTLPTIKPEPAQ